MVILAFVGDTWPDVLGQVRVVVSDAAAPSAPSTGTGTVPRPIMRPRLRFSPNARRLLDHVAAASGPVHASVAAQALGVRSVKGIASHMSTELRAAGFDFDSLVRRDWDDRGTFYELNSAMPPELRAAAFPQQATQASSQP